MYRLIAGRFFICASDLLNRNHRSTIFFMNKPETIPHYVKPAKPAVTPAVETEVRRRLKTLPQDAKAARPYSEAHADLIRPYVPK